MILADSGGRATCQRLIATDLNRGHGGFVPRVVQAASVSG